VYKVYQRCVGIGPAAFYIWVTVKKARKSAMKDFYDIWLLSCQFDFDGAELTETIRLTFERRGTVPPIEVERFDEAFIDVEQVQWTAFWKRLQQDHVPISLISLRVEFSAAC